jgi:ABC-type bacteriocin/lantibiotic exporter with double-glycine peptidase domain
MQIASVIGLFLQMLDSFLAMSSMFGYTATLVLIPLLAALAYVSSSWIIGTLITGWNNSDHHLLQDTEY